MNVYSWQCSSASDAAFLDSPLFEVSDHADKLHLEFPGVTGWGAVPCVDGVALRDQKNLTFPQNFLGEIGILHIHEVLLIESADTLQNLCSDSHKTAGAKFNGTGLG